MSDFNFNPSEQRCGRDIVTASPPESSILDWQGYQTAGIDARLALAVAAPVFRGFLGKTGMFSKKTGRTISAQTGNH